MREASARRTRNFVFRQRKFAPYPRFRIPFEPSGMILAMIMIHSYFNRPTFCTSPEVGLEGRHLDMWQRFHWTMQRTNVKESPGPKLKSIVTQH